MQLYYGQQVSAGMMRLDGDEARHVFLVMRHRPGDLLLVTDGRGGRYRCRLLELGREEAMLEVVERFPNPTPAAFSIHVGIAPTKQADRFEWFLEKATELGVTAVTPVICRRSERQHLRLDRLEKIMISAMKQSSRFWLPELNAPLPFEDWVSGVQANRKYLCWLPEEEACPPLSKFLHNATDVAVAIGPAGDFDPAEVSAALNAGFRSISLGEARLRTETAGVLAVALLRHGVSI
jgi:16S rRNA (uracil1498-N3)-methyltransferase